MSETDKHKAAAKLIEEQLDLALAAAAKDVEQQFLTQLGGVVQGGTAAAAKLADIARKAASLKVKAMRTTNEVERKQLEEAIDTYRRAARTTALAQGVVESDRMAAWVQALLDTGLNLLEDLAVKLIGALAQAAVQGAVQGLVGGDGGKPSGLSFR